MHQDHLGSTVASTTAAGAIAWREDFTPYGEKRLDPNANKDDEGFTGHVDDAATGLTYMQARYYDPVIGRFLSNDPMSFVGSKYDVRYFTRYAYVGNNPINATDPTGEAIETAWDIANVVIGAASAADNLSKGNYGDAAIDAVGVVVDGAATVVPFVPGGASSAIKVSRTVDRASRLADAHKKAVGSANRATRAAGFANNNKFGKAIGWGGGRNAAQQATSRIGQINSKTVANMKRQGVTKGLVKKWRNAYGAASAAGKGGDVAKARGKLMQKILDNW